MPAVRADGGSGHHDGAGEGRGQTHGAHRVLVLVLVVRLVLAAVQVVAKGGSGVIAGDGVHGQAQVVGASAGVARVTAAHHPGVDDLRGVGALVAAPADEGGAALTAHAGRLQGLEVGLRLCQLMTHAVHCCLQRGHVQGPGLQAVFGCPRVSGRRWRERERNWIGLDWIGLDLI